MEQQGRNPSAIEQMHWRWKPGATQCGISALLRAKAPLPDVGVVPLLRDALGNERLEEGHDALHAGSFGRLLGPQLCDEHLRGPCHDFVGDYHLLPHLHALNSTPP